ncbi:MAG: amidohydrolase family protein [Planctomycetota bacterium]
MPGQLLEKHWLIIEDGRVVGIEKFRAIDSRRIAAVHELGNAVVMPGFVNAHTHLDTCCLSRRVPYTGKFTSWLEQFVASRRAATPDEIDAGVRTGLQQAIRGGTTSIGDVALTDRSYGPLRESGMRGVYWLAVFGFDPALASTATERLRTRMETLLQRDLTTGDSGRSPSHKPLLRFGVAPDAPYSVSRELYVETLRLMVERGDRFCTHIAETDDERTLLQVCEGEFIPFLEAMFPEGLPSIGGAASPVAYLADLLAEAQPPVPPSSMTSRFRIIRPPVLVHANFLDPDDINLIAKLRAPVVICPRHRAFFHGDKRPHPLHDLLARSQTVAIGTESLATNDSLSMLDEMRWLARSPDAPDPATILRMGTLYGARALDIEDQVGVLAPGMMADLTAVAVPAATNPDRVLDAVLRGDGPVTFTMVGGQPVWQRP